VLGVLGGMDRPHIGGKFRRRFWSMGINGLGGCPNQCPTISEGQDMSPKRPDGRTRTMSITTGRHAAVKFAASIVILASFAIGLSACGTANSSLPMISAAQVASGQPLPEGILPNGIVYQPYNNG
jgi:hypothetical protein